jgi:hypothetical protein
LQLSRRVGKGGQTEREENNLQENKVSCEAVERSCKPSEIAGNGNKFRDSFVVFTEISGL